MKALDPRAQEYFEDERFRIHLKYINLEIVESQIFAVLWEEGRPEREARQRERHELEQNDSFALDTLRSENLMREVMKYAEKAQARAPAPS